MESGCSLHAGCLTPADPRRPACPRPVTLPAVDSVLTSLIAVIGTLAGSSLTYLFGRLTARRTERIARDERLRQERVAAYAAFVGSMTELRQALISLWFLKRESPSAQEAQAAYVEADKRGAAAH